MSATGRTPRFFVETWGCQMNELDSQRMAGQMMAQGLLPTADPADADLILLNSCSVREKAQQKVYSRLGEYRLLKQGRPQLRIGLCGCVAQQEGERALARVPDLDFVLGPARVGELGGLMPRIRSGERLVATGFAAERKFDLDAISRDGSFKGMVTVVEGCDKRCTFCIVPSTRGPEQSRELDQILAEVRHLLALGFEEIELLGQTVNHWRDERRGLDFADLLDAVAPLPGLRRLRFVTSYPRDFTPRMIDRFAIHANLADYFHLPVQSGSDRVLKRMGRGYTAADYLEVARLARAARPSLALSTDLIVGFPGETEEDFLATLRLVEEVDFSAIFAFNYSPRPGTAALRLEGEIPISLAQERLQRLLAFHNRIQAAANLELIGRRFELMVTGPGREPGHWSGRTSCHRIVHFETPPSDASVRPGRFVWARVVAAMGHSLRGLLDIPPAGGFAPAGRGRLPVLNSL